MMKIVKYNDIRLSDALRIEENPRDVSDAVKNIIAGVRARGDAALRGYTREFDGAELSAFEVTREEWDAAVAEVDAAYMRVLERAAKNIAEFHKNQIRRSFISHGTDGAVMGQKITPIERVALYIPGGTAAYPSVALMNAIPAKLAGVPELIMTTPPGADGGIKNPHILAAARVAGVDRVFKLGGAQAVAAFAYGTESVPRADKIVGPGNAYVAEAKRQVFGVVGIDMMAGPSDVCVIADSFAPSEIIAADMLAQAEHDELARAVLITDSEALARAVADEIERQLVELPRRDIAARSIENTGLIIVCGSIDEAVDISNELAPEHLEIITDNAFDYLERVKNAGSVFLGPNTPEALGDYMAGPNNTLPTLGTARFASPVSVDDFVKKTSFTYFSRKALEDVGADVIRFAESEGLTAHAESVKKRLNE